MIKCPICNVELEQIGDLFQCRNDHCSYVGNKNLWEALSDAIKKHLT